MTDRSSPETALVTDEMVNAACAVYERVYLDEDRSAQQAIRAAIEAALRCVPAETPDTDRFDTIGYPGYRTGLTYGDGYKAALAAQRTHHEPVAWRTKNDFGHWHVTQDKALAETWIDIEKFYVEPLYAAPVSSTKRRDPCDHKDCPRIGLPASLSLQERGGCACTSIDRSHCNEPNCTFTRPQRTGDQ